MPRAYASRARSGPARYFVCSKVFSKAKICWPENVGLVCFFLPSLSTTTVLAWEPYRWQEPVEEAKNLVNTETSFSMHAAVWSRQHLHVTITLEVYHVTSSCLAAQVSRRPEPGFKLTKTFGASSRRGLSTSWALSLTNAPRIVTAKQVPLVRALGERRKSSATRCC